MSKDRNVRINVKPDKLTNYWGEIILENVENTPHGMVHHISLSLLEAKDICKLLNEKIGGEK